MLQSSKPVGHQEASAGKRMLYPLFVLIFTASGFAGLIYESIWAQYLKLFLGHAAYAQTLVLAIFMGGMALGAWIASRYSSRWQRLLLGYAIVEAIIGILALAFHDVFVGFVNISYHSIIPALGPSAAVEVYKWLGATALIITQSVLLGMTFPLMTAGIVRRYPDRPGATIAMLYFANSLGAAAGVLASGFLLIDAVGLPGTVRIAGMMNIALAVMVAIIAARWRDRFNPHITLQKENNQGARLLLLLALGTGTASFIYEVVWLRMLSLVLSSSTHAFELMLSAFILGLAFGGLWIRRRLDKLSDPAAFLASVQILMGSLALLTLPLYGLTFTSMEFVVGLLPANEAGYTVFNLFSHLIALAVMFPATFCAGMTLPLVTYTLLKQGGGERSIGAVYAWNTVGAIIGVFLTVHLGFPLLGLKGTLVVGGALDIALGLLLIYRLADRGFRFRGQLQAAAAGVLFLVVLLAVQLDPYKIASGVYRLGVALSPESTEIVFHEDGKTASIDLINYPGGGTLTVSTNGKPDASITMTPGGNPTNDQSTMTMAGILPLTLLPDARLVANIGLGSGLTAHAILAAPWIERVDTIEIEPAIVRASRGFGVQVERAYSDPRSHIIIDDAKSWFASTQTRYDIVISEPSNPWVSGVAGLFSTEFYDHLKHYMADDGLLVQWFQLYETDVSLVASVLKAVAENFSDYVLYAANGVDLLIVATDGGLIGEPSASVLAEPAIAAELAKVGMRTPADFNLRRIADRQILDPLLHFFSEPANSDYYPFLDQNAAKARYLGSNATELTALADAPLPVLEMLEKRSVYDPQNMRVTADRFFPRTTHVNTAAAIYDFVVQDQVSPEYELIGADMRTVVEYIKLSSKDCQSISRSEVFIDNLLRFASATGPNLPRESLTTLWTRLNLEACQQELSPLHQEWIGLVRAVSERDAANMSRLADLLLTRKTRRSYQRYGYLVIADMLGNLAMGKPELAVRTWETHSASIFGKTDLDLLLLLLAAHANEGL